MTFIIIFHSKMCFQQYSNNQQNIYLHISNLSNFSTQKEPEQGLQRGLFSGEQSESLFAVRRLMESFYEKFVQRHKLFLMTICWFFLPKTTRLVSKNKKNSLNVRVKLEQDF